MIVLSVSENDTVYGSWFIRRPSELSCMCVYSIEIFVKGVEGVFAFRTGCLIK